jgi:hypothetical protein
MENPATDRTVDERKAAALLGLSLPDLRWLSRLLGVGHMQRYGHAVQIVFTSEELKRLSSGAATSAK